MLRRRCGFTVAPLTFGKRKHAMSQHALDLVRSKGKLPARYGNFIGGKWVEPTDDQYFYRLQPDQRRATGRCGEVDPARCGNGARSGPQGQRRLGTLVA